jgi:hypothetical protein
MGRAVPTPLPCPSARGAEPGFLKRSRALRGKTKSYSLYESKFFGEREEVILNRLSITVTLYNSNNFYILTF